MPTENGNLVGVFTVEGTLALLLFGGLLGGSIAAVVWVVISPWLPDDGRARMVLAAPVAAALGSSLVVEATNTDFRVLDPDPLLIAMFVGLVGLVGLATAWLDGVLERRLPGAGAGRVSLRLLAYGALALLGTPALILTIMAYLSPEFSQGEEPFAVGIALLVAGATTAVWWASRVVNSATRPAPTLRLASQLAVLAGVGLGAIHVWDTATRIVAGG